MNFSLTPSRLTYALLKASVSNFVEGPPTRGLNCLFGVLSTRGSAGTRLQLEEYTLGTNPSQSLRRFNARVGTEEVENQFTTGTVQLRKLHLFVLDQYTCQGLSVEEVKAFSKGKS